MILFVCFTILFLIFFMGLRIDTHLIIRENMSLSAYKKKKKAQNFIEWFLYSQFRDAIPKRWLIYYFKSVIQYFFTMLISIAFYYGKPNGKEYIFFVVVHFFSWGVESHIIDSKTRKGVGNPRDFSCYKIEMRKK